MTVFTYLARCNDKSLYTSSCFNISKREQNQNKGERSQYTKKRLPVHIIYFEKFNSLIETRQREKQIKGWSRIKKENLIKFGHPIKRPENID